MKTTERDFAYFGAQVRHWAAKLGLHDWDIRFEHADAKDILASVRCDVGAKVASMTLAKNWATDAITDEALGNTAKHEVLHILLADLCDLVSSHVPPGFVIGVEHAIVRRLEKIL